MTLYISMFVCTYICTQSAEGLDTCLCDVFGLSVQLSTAGRYWRQAQYVQTCSKETHVKKLWICFSWNVPILNSVCSHVVGKLSVLIRMCTLVVYLYIGCMFVCVHRCKTQRHKQALIFHQYLFGFLYMLPFIWIMSWSMRPEINKQINKQANKLFCLCGNCKCVSYDGFQRELKQRHSHSCLWN